MEHIKRKEVLDHGYVLLVDVMGDDNAIADAARVSYDKGTTQVRNNERLIKYLYSHDHSSPFEQVEFKFEVKLPMFVARQMVRHRTASLNEVSARYSVLEDEFYVPKLERLNTQHNRNKQQSSNEIVHNPEEVRNKIIELQQKSYQTYKELLDQGLVRELARNVLPVSIYTKWVWKIDLKNLLHFIRLRESPDAQYEIKVYAEAMLDLIEPYVPITIQAYRERYPKTQIL